MRKVNNTHANNISNIMYATIVEYKQQYVKSSEDKLELQDVYYNAKALHKFGLTRNAQELHNAIMLQDTLVREYFYTTLKYIEDNKLINPQYWVCKAFA